MPRQTILAVQSLQTRFVDGVAPAYYSDLAYHQCRSLATKISEDVVKWLKTYMKLKKEPPKKPPRKKLEN